MKAPQKTAYRITDKAGEYIAGKRRVPGAETVMLTGREAAYELSLGTIELMGEPTEDKSAARKRAKATTADAGETGNGEGGD